MRSIPHQQTTVGRTTEKLYLLIQYRSRHSPPISHLTSTRFNSRKGSSADVPALFSRSPSHSPPELVRIPTPSTQATTPDWGGKHSVKDATINADKKAMSGSVDVGVHLMLAVEDELVKTRLARLLKAIEALV